MQQQGGWRHRFGYVTSALDTDALYIYIWREQFNVDVVCGNMHCNHQPQMLQCSAPHKVETNLYASVVTAFLLRNDTFLLEPLAPILENKTQDTFMLQIALCRMEVLTTTSPILTIISTIVHKSCTRYQPPDYNHYILLVFTDSIISYHDVFILFWCYRVEIKLGTDVARLRPVDRCMYFHSL